MPKRSSTPKDINQLAASILRAATQQAEVPQEDEIKRVMRAMGRMGGLKGGKARAASLSPSERARIARKAAKARWRNPDGK
jgi:hypothetical protein